MGRLEAGGLMVEINKRLADDSEFRQALAASTEKYCFARDGRGTPEHVRHPGGGPERVKCLHAHLAHHLVTEDNPVGAWVVEELARAGRGPNSATPSSPCV